MFISLTIISQHEKSFYNIVVSPETNDIKIVFYNTVVSL